MNALDTSLLAWLITGATGTGSISTISAPAGMTTILFRVWSERKAMVASRILKRSSGISAVMVSRRFIERCLRQLWVSEVAIDPLSCSFAFYSPIWYALIPWADGAQ
jgi:hypothetical protein